MPPFLVLIIKYSSEVCLVSRVLEEMESSEKMHPGLDAPGAYLSGWPQPCTVQPAQLHRWPGSLLQTVLLVYLGSSVP